MFSGSSSLFQENIVCFDHSLSLVFVLRLRRPKMVDDGF